MAATLRAADLEGVPEPIARVLARALRLDPDERPASMAEFRADLIGALRALGTPAYMAPEQALGCAWGPFTDVWSIGVVFVRCLTGRLPFDGLASRGIASLRSGFSGRISSLAFARPMMKIEKRQTPPSRV
jgi:hypothetical protein